MNKQVRLWDRYSVQSLMENKQDPNGRLFLSELGQCNLEGVRVLHQGLDTVKQLYTGILQADLLETIESLYLEGFGECIELAGHPWAIGSGGASGYQFRLQNSDLGLICFVKSRYADKADSASHVKIEASPHWLYPRSHDQIAKELNALARHFFISHPTTSGVAVHMCIDVQGWEPPRDFQDRLVTRARRIVSHDSQKLLYWDLGEVASTYNRGQSYLVGSAASVQLAVYRKDVQAKAIDKLDFWQDVWKRTPGEDFDKPAYQEGKPVWRLELRFHHSVLAEFGRGVAQGMEYGFTLQGNVWSGVLGVSQHLQGLWQYGLNSFRLETRNESGFIRYLDPMWQLLIESVEFSAPRGDVMYKRVKKTPGLGNEKNLMLAVGNLLSIYARNRFTPAWAFKCLQDSGVYEDLERYFENRAYSRLAKYKESDIFEFVCKSLQLRTLYGKAA